MAWPWNELGLSGPAGPEEIKHAYAQRLKQIHPEEDPEGFQRLHRAYQLARRLSRTGAGAHPEPEAPETCSPNSQLDSPFQEPEPEDGADQEWDFQSLFSQEEPRDDTSQEEETAWVPPVYRYEASSVRRGRSILRNVLGLAAALLLVVLAFRFPSWFSKSTADKAAETQRWLERTFQIQLVSSQANRDREEDRFLYWLKEDPDVRLQGIWGEDGAFQTNYPNVRVFWDMKAFSQEWPDYPLWFDQEMTDQTGEGAEGGSPPLLFLFQVPLEGAEDFLYALAAQLEQMSSADWYVRQPPEYLIALAHGEAILCSYNCGRQDVPTSSELLSYYHEQLCGPLLEDLLFQQDVVLWDYPSDENLIWANTGEGSVLDAKGWWISCRGIGRDGTDLTMYYFLREDYTALYCIPGEALDHWDDGFVLSCTETRTMSCGRDVEIYRVL